jgi:hypothetical protein
VPVALHVSELTYDASPSTNWFQNTPPPESPKHEPPPALESFALIWNATTSVWTLLRNDVVERRCWLTICAFLARGAGRSGRNER